MKSARGIAGLLAALLWGGVAVRSAAPQPNFSGTWVLDRTQSGVPSTREIPESLLAVGELTLVIDHQGATLKIERRVKALMVERSLVATYYTDGREVVNTNPRGQPVHSRSYWQGSTLITELRGTVEWSGKMQAMKGKDSLRLSDDGRLLILEGVRSFGDGDTQQARLIFVKP